MNLRALRIRCSKRVLFSRKTHPSSIFRLHGTTSAPRRRLPPRPSNAAWVEGRAAPAAARRRRPPCSAGAFGGRRVRIQRSPRSEKAFFRTSVLQDAIPETDVFKESDETQVSSKNLVFQTRKPPKPQTKKERSQPLSAYASLPTESAHGGRLRASHQPGPHELLVGRGPLAGAERRDAARAGTSEPRRGAWEAWRGREPGVAVLKMVEGGRTLLGLSGGVLVKWLIKD